MENSKLMHIEGLRGIAIILIILFHAFPSILPNGYIGVDVFFVISGYLLFRKPLFGGDKGTADVCKTFILKKVIRVMQPLSVIVLFALACGYCFLTPEDLQAGAKTAIAALFCTSNFYLDSLTDGYFGADSAYNPLVHSWYLSVLCQLFLLFMSGSWILRKVSRKTAQVSLSLVAAMSFVAFHEPLISSSLAYCLVDFNRDGICYPSFSYYSASGRLWEILAGGCIAILPVPKNRTRIFAVASLGLALVVFSVIGIPREWLGKYAKIIRYVLSDSAVIGTVMLLAYGKTGWVYKILTMRVWLLLGAISFSLYLVHMPIVISWRSMMPVHGWWVYIGLLLSVVAAAVFFYFGVERRKFSRISAWLLWLAALGGGVFVVKYKPQLPLWDESDLVYREHRYDWQYCNDSFLDGYDTAKLSMTNMVGSMSGKDSFQRHELLYMGDGSRTPHFILLGDSHAASLFYGLDEFCHEESLCGLYSTTYVTPAHDCTRRKTVWYQAWFPEKERALMEWLDKHLEIDTVIIAENWPVRIGGIPSESVKQFVRNFAERGIKVIVALPIPTVSTTTSLRRSYRLGKARGLGNPDIYAISYGEYCRSIAATMKVFEEMEAEGICKVLRISDGLFQDGVFSAYDNGELMMYDYFHLSPEGSRRAIFGCRDQLLLLLGRTQDHKAEE